MVAIETEGLVDTHALISWRDWLMSITCCNSRLLFHLALCHFSPPDYHAEFSPSFHYLFPKLEVELGSLKSGQID